MLMAAHTPVFVHVGLYAFVYVLLLAFLDPFLFAFPFPQGSLLRLSCSPHNHNQHYRPASVLSARPALILEPWVSHRSANPRVLRYPIMRS